MKNLSKRKRLLFWLIFILIFTIIPLALLEGGGRFYIYLKHGVPGKTYGLWRYDEVLGAQHRENGYNTVGVTNDFGFRNNEDVLEPKPDGSTRIIAYGGSTTFCYNLSNDDAWPLQLQSILRKNRNSSDQVLNAGAILWSIGHAYARAKKDIPTLKPDYVIIYSGINETINATSLAKQGKALEKMVGEGRFGEFATNYEQNRWAKRNLFIVRALDYLIKPHINVNIPKPKEWAAQSEGKQDDIKVDPRQAILDNYLHLLEQFIGLIKEYGGMAVFVIQAEGKNTEKTLGLISYSVSGGALAERLGATVVDARKIVATYEGNPMDLFYHTGVHYSKLGAERVATLIFHEVFEDR